MPLLCPLGLAAFRAHRIAVLYLARRLGAACAEVGLGSVAWRGGGQGLATGRLLLLPCLLLLPNLLLLAVPLAPPPVLRSIQQSSVQRVLLAGAAGRGVRAAGLCPTPRSWKAMPGFWVFRLACYRSFCCFICRILSPEKVQGDSPMEIAAVQSSTAGLDFSQCTNSTSHQKFYLSQALGQAAQASPVARQERRLHGAPHPPPQSRQQGTVAALR